MQPTSHFIGIRVMPELLVDIFIKVQNLFLEDPAIIEFQNILSTHISLYYLPPDISSEKMIVLQNIIFDCNADKISGTLIHYAYFGETISPRLAYLVPDNYDTLFQLHKHLKASFPEYGDVPDNMYPVFVPHMTFFKIKDQEKFGAKKTEVEKIIVEELQNLQNKNMYGEIAIYQVNSGFTPEIQIQIK